ncbi:hypothetical protein C5F59_009260 [Streptomyces sp. QL37]|uniref:hypothetical protein n=1 Tax=Streptomyces sp. QL37 TaxID=2093747 RepID=UPI0011B0D40B|nr:hypothetical protein [Streptomyces sp. QL37]
MDFLFESPVSPENVLRRVMEDGFRLSKDGVFSYLFDDQGEYGWRIGDSRQLDAIVTDMGADRWAESVVGISVYFPGENGGGELIFQPDRRTISFLITVDRKNIPGSMFCDMGWYLGALRPTFEALGATGVETTDVA